MFGKMDDSTMADTAIVRISRQQPTSWLFMFLWKLDIKTLSF